MIRRLERWDGGTLGPRKAAWYLDDDGKNVTRLPFGLLSIVRYK